MRRAVIIGDDIELWEEPWTEWAERAGITRDAVMHGCWTKGIVARDADFWLRVGNWLVGGDRADLRVLAAGTWGEHRTSLCEARDKLDEARAALDRVLGRE